MLLTRRRRERQPVWYRRLKVSIGLLWAVIKAMTQMNCFASYEIWELLRTLPRMIMKEEPVRLTGERCGMKVTMSARRKENWWNRFLDGAKRLAVCGR